MRVAQGLSNEIQRRVVGQGCKQPSLKQYGHLAEMDYCTGLENRRTARFPGFESLSVRHKHTSIRLVQTVRLTVTSGERPAQKYGLLVEWFKMPACHAGDDGFNSHTGRQIERKAHSLRLARYDGLGGKWLSHGTGGSGAA